MFNRPLALLALAGSCLFSTAVLADEPAPAAPAAPPKTVILNTGEVLRGTLISEDDQSIKLQHPVLGFVTIPKSQLQQQLDTPAGAPVTLPAPQPPVVPPPPPPPPPATIWDGWKASVDLGINGATGNTENFNIRAGAGLKREAPDMDTSLTFLYQWATDDGVKSRSRAELNGRNDWKFGDSPWGLFGLGRLEFDEFTNYKWRASGYFGPSYTLLKPDPFLLRFRAGAGGKYEWAGPSPIEEFVPEALLGVDFTWKINERSDFFFTYDYLPSLSEPPDFRLDGKTGLSYKLDPTTNTILKTGVAHRYNSNPGGLKRNDVEYFLTIGWEF